MKAFIKVILVFFLASFSSSQNPNPNNNLNNANRVLNHAQNSIGAVQGIGGLLPDRYGKPLTAAAGITGFQTTILREGVNNRDLINRRSNLQRSQSWHGSLVSSTPNPYDRTISLSNIAGSGATMTQGVASMANRNRLAGRAGIAASASTLYNEGVRNRDLLQKRGGISNPNNVDRVGSGLSVLGAGADIVSVAGRNRKTQAVATGVSAATLVGKGIYDNREVIGNAASRLNTRLNSPMTSQQSSSQRIKDFQENGMFLLPN